MYSLSWSMWMNIVLKVLGPVDLSQQPHLTHAACYCSWTFCLKCVKEWRVLVCLFCRSALGVAAQVTMWGVQELGRWAAIGYWLTTSAVQCYSGAPATHTYTSTIRPDITATNWDWQYITYSLPPQPVLLFWLSGECVEHGSAVAAGFLQNWLEY